MDDWTDFKEEFFVGLVILTDFIGSNDSNRIIIFDGVSFFTEKTFFGILIVFESDVAMIGVGFLFWVFPVALGREKLDINDFTKSWEIFCDFLFAIIIRDFVDVDLMIGEAFFQRDCFTCHFDVW